MVIEGVVRSWIEDRAFGFIKYFDEELGEDTAIFAHITRLRGGLDRLVPGERVTFEISMNERTGKPMAINVRVVSQAVETI